MSLDLSPAPGAAAPLRRLLTQTAMELRLTLRNGEQLLLTFVIPVLLLVAGSEPTATGSRGVIMRMDMNGTVRDARWIAGGVTVP